jgi:hypothetical protein
MSNGFNFGVLLIQLSYAGPSLLVYLFAGFMAVTYMERARRPSVLTLIGIAISVLATLGTVIGQTLVINTQIDREQVSQVMQFIGAAGSILRAAGLGFFVAAIFSGRNSPPPEDRYLRESDVDNEPRP